MNNYDYNIETLKGELLALIDEHKLIETKLASQIESDDKVLLSTHRDEIVNRIIEIYPKIQEHTSKDDGIQYSVVGSPLPDLAINIGYTKATEKGPHSLRTWWHSILRKHGQHSCYAVFLLLPSDKEAIRYLSEFGKELDLITGKECLVIAFGKTEFKSPKFDDGIWSALVDEHVAEGVSVKIAKMFNLEFTQFPCLIVFKDIRLPEHVVITLKDCTSENIAKDLRQVFSIINKATSKKQDPLQALSLMRKAENFQKTGLSIVSEIQSFAGKTLDMAMEAFIKTRIQ